MIDQTVVVGLGITGKLTFVGGLTSCFLAEALRTQW